MVKALKTNQSMQELDLRDNSLQNTVITELYSVLKENYTVKSIKLTFTPAIGPVLCSPPDVLAKIYSEIFEPLEPAA